MAKMLRLHMVLTLSMQAFALQTGKRGKSPLAGCEGIGCVKAYIEMPDPSFSWYDTHVRLNGVDETTQESWTGYVLNMTSQKWTSGATPFVEYPLWWHVLVVVIPSKLEAADWANVIFECGIPHPEFQAVEHVSVRRDPEEKDVFYRNQTLQPHMVVDGNNLVERIPALKKGVQKAAYLATHTRSVSASLFSPLNDYEVFPDDPEHLLRSDDYIKAYSWQSFLENGGDEPERIMEMPVARAGSRALDAVAEFTASLPSGEVSRFGLLGYSKYGTAVWMLGAVGDHRVKAIAPVAMPPDFGHHGSDIANILRSEGPNAFSSLLSEGSFLRSEPSTAVREMVGKDYSAIVHPTIEEAYGIPSNPKSVYDGFNLMAAQRPDLASKLSEIIDPVFYLHKITVPTFFVMDTNDVWFGSQTPHMGEWWPLLKSPKRMLIMEAEHEDIIVVALPSVAAFFRGQILGEAMPQMEFRKARTSITATQRSASTPLSVRLHYGSSCEADGSFLHSNFYRSGELTRAEDEKKWVAQLNAPEVKDFNGFVGDCGSELGPKGEFVQVEYAGPPPGIDNYKFSSEFYID